MKLYCLLTGFLVASQMTFSENSNLINNNIIKLDNFEKTINLKGGEKNIFTEKNGVEVENLKIINNSTLNIKSKNDEVENRGLTIHFKNNRKDKNIIIENGSTLNIESYFLKPFNEFAFDDGSNELFVGIGWQEDKRLTRGLYIKSDYELQNLSIGGNLNIYSTAFGWDSYYGIGKRMPEDSYNKENHNVYYNYNNKEKKLIFDFLSNSNTYIEAGFTGMFLGRQNPELNFYPNSNLLVKAGGFGIHTSSREGSFKRAPSLLLHNNSNLEVSANWGIKLRGGTLDFTPVINDNDAATLKVYGRKVGICDLSIRERNQNQKATDNFAKAKAIIVGHDALTRVSGKLHLIKGSEIEGNISNCDNLSLIMDKGTSLYGDEVLYLKSFKTKGDVFVGQKSNYQLDGYGGASQIENKVSKFSEKEINNLITVVNKNENQLKNNPELLKARKTLSSLDGISGASYILVGGIKKTDETTIKEIELVNLAKKYENDENNHIKDTFDAILEINKYKTNNSNWSYSMEEAKQLLKTELNLSDYTLNEFKTKTHIKNYYDTLKKIEFHNPNEYNELWIGNGEFSFDNCNIHLRIGDTQNVAESKKKTNHDTIIFEKSAKVNNLSGNIILHPTGNIKNIRKHHIFKNLIDISPKYSYVNLNENIQKVKNQIKNSNEKNDSNYNLNIRETDIGPYVLQGKNNIFKDYDKKAYIKYNVDPSDEAKLEREYSNYLAKEFFKEFPELNYYGLEYNEILPSDEIKTFANKNIEDKVGNRKIHIKIKEGTNLHGKNVNDYIFECIDKVWTNKFANAYNNYTQNRMTIEEFAKTLNKTSDEELTAREYNKALEEKLALTLKFTNKLSKAAQREFYASYNSNKNFLYSLNTISNAIFDNKNIDNKTKNNAWFVSNNNSFKNKETNNSFNQNIVAAGYDHLIAKNTSIGFTIGKAMGDYKGENYGVYLNTKFTSLFLIDSRLKYNRKYREKNIGLIVGDSFKNNKFSVTPSIKFIFRKTKGMNYSNNLMNIEIAKDNSMFTEFSLKAGYNINDYLNLYSKYSIGKDLGRHYNVVFNDDLSKKVNGQYLTQTIQLGTNINIFDTSNFNIEVGKGFSDKFKSDINIKASYEIKF